MFVALNSSSLERVDAIEAFKADKHICPKCKADVNFAKGKIRRPHFRHRPDSNCAFGIGETWQHQEAKQAILSGARNRGLQAEAELEVISVEGDRRADVVLWAPQTDPAKSDDVRRRAFEVQHSSIDDESLVSRTNAYMAAGVPVMWIPVVDESKFKNKHKILDSDMHRIYEYSIPSWMNAIFKLHGHMWLYIPQTKGFWKGWKTPFYRWREGKEWYDADGTQNWRPSAWYPAAKVIDLFVEGPFDFGSLKISVVDRSNSELFKGFERKRFLTDLISPGSTRNSIKRAEKRRSDLDDYTGYYHYSDWVLVNEEWREARFERVSSLPVIASA